VTIVKTFDVQCDGDGCLAWEHGVTAVHSANAGAARKAVRAKGWKHRGGLDLCPLCAEGSS
jgi:hypothetical protein